MLDNQEQIFAIELAVHHCITRVIMLNKTRIVQWAENTPHQLLSVNALILIMHSGYINRARVTGLSSYDHYLF